MCRRRRPGSPSFSTLLMTVRMWRLLDRARIRLVPIEPPAQRELGFFPLAVSDELFEPLGGEDLTGWK